MSEEPITTGTFTRLTKSARHLFRRIYEQSSDGAQTVDVDATEGQAMIDIEHLSSAGLIELLPYANPHRRRARLTPAGLRLAAAVL
jgi:hypothetical protein